MRSLTLSIGGILVASVLGTACDLSLPCFPEEGTYLPIRTDAVVRSATVDDTGITVIVVMADGSEESARYVFGTPDTSQAR
jgi:hypothetical protein